MYSLREREVRLWFTHAESREKQSDGTLGAVFAVTFRKAGQWPAQWVEPSREVVKELKEPVLEMFKRGLTSLTHGFGLGTLTYFRCVVEDVSVI